MAEKRSAPSGDATQNGVKKARADDGSPMSTGANGNKPISDAAAAARARAEAIRAKMAGNKQSSSTMTATPTNAVPASGTSPGLSSSDSIRAKLEAMKARGAAAALAASVPSKSKQQTTPSVPERNDAPVRARGGINIGVHPLLAEESMIDQRAKERGAMQPKFGTTIGNQRPHSPFDRPGSGAKKRQIGHSTQTRDGTEKDNPYLDPAAGVIGKIRASRALAFNARGKYIAQANAQRKQAQLEAIKKSIEDSARKAALEEDRTEEAYLVKDVPDVEWWDEPLIDGAQYPDFDHDPQAEEKLKLTGPESLVVSQINHPVPIEPLEYSSFKAKAMPLTKKEQGKKRRQERLTDLQEQQAKVRLGLEAAEPPKVNRKNMFRVYGEEAVKDPTAVEMRVDREVAERFEKHENMNEERKLTKEERDEKIKEKAKADADKGLVITVYRIASLAYIKNRMKIDMNAKQCLDVTGMLITNPKSNIVIFEAGRHSTEFLKKLMQRRIAWTENAPSTADRGEDSRKGPVPQWLWPEDEGGSLKDLSDNRCDLIWEGEKKKRAFGRWSEKDCETEGEVRETLERAKMVNLWQMAKNWVPE